MKRLRVLHIITGLETGGAETSLCRLVSSTSSDADHLVVSLTTRGTQAEGLESEGATVVALQWKRGSVRLTGLAFLVRLVRTFSPDVIHSWMYHANLIATTVALLTGTRNRLVWGVRHSLDHWQSESLVLRAIIRAGTLLSLVPKAIVYNSMRSRSQHEALGYRAKGNAVIPNGFDTTRFCPDTTLREQTRTALGITPETLIVSLVARVHPIKDHTTFLAAAAKVREAVPNVRFLLAGRGTDVSDNQLATRVRELQLQDSIIALGDRRDVEAIYNASDISVLTSTSEAFPNTVGEAMACGIPVVTTNVGDAALIVGDTGRVVATGDVTACADAWTAMLRESILERSRRGSAARNRIVSQFGLQRSREAYQQLWSSIVTDSSQFRPMAHEAAPNQKRRVLHILTASMSLNFLRGQYEYFAGNNVELHVACSPGPELDRWAAQHPETAHAIPISRRIAPFADLVSLWRLWVLIRRCQFDVVHAGTPKGGLLGTIAARLCRVPMRIYHLRGLPLSTATGIRRVVMRVTERLAIASSTNLLVVSDSLRSEVVAHGLAALDTMQLIGAGSSNGVDARQRFNPENVHGSSREQVRAQHRIPADAVVIGFIGRLTRDKGIAELLEAWRTVRTSTLNAHLLIVGIDDDTSDETARIVSAFRADPRVHLHGTDWNTPPLYASMDLLVLPTYREGFPNVLLEAAAMQLPVVATNVPGCVDAVRDGETGLLVPARDARALAAALEQYVGNPSLRHAHGAIARQHILAHFDQRVIWNGLLSLYMNGTTGSSVVSDEVDPAISKRRAA